MRQGPPTILPQVPTLVSYVTAPLIVALAVTSAGSLCEAQSPIHREDILVNVGIDGAPASPKMMYLESDPQGQARVLAARGKVGIGFSSTVGAPSAVRLYVVPLSGFGTLIEPAEEIQVDPFEATFHAQIGIPRDGFADLTKVISYAKAGIDGGQDKDVATYDQVSDTEIYSWAPGISQDPDMAELSMLDRIALVFRGSEDLSGTPVNTILGQVFDSFSVPFTLGSTFEVNDLAGSVLSPAVGSYYSLLPESESYFAMSWESFVSGGGDNDLSSIQMRRFDPDGTPLGGQVQVNTSTAGFQRAPDVAGLSDGNTVIVWQSDSSAGDDNSLTSIQGQLYDNDGLPLGSEFQINTETLGNQFEPTVAAQSNGGFIVAWSTNPVADADIAARQYAAGAVPRGDEFRVNTVTSGNQGSPDVAAADEEWAVTWQGGTGIWVNGSFGSVFRDGFETGNTSNWF